MSLPLSIKARELQCLALLYHHVGQRQPGAYPDLTVSPQDFKRQIRWLVCRGYSGIRPAEWLEWRRTGNRLPRKPILITFDDAYADIAEHALPVLHEFGFGAAVFVATAHIGGASTWDERLGYRSLPVMSAEQIRYWALRGIEFGSHSHTHPDLTGLTQCALHDELVRSATAMRQLLGRPACAFAYPFGAQNSTVQQAVKNCFDLAFTADAGFNSRLTDLHLLQRNRVKADESILGFSMMVQWGQHWRSKLALRTRLRRATGTELCKTPHD